MNVPIMVYIINTMGMLSGISYIFTVVTEHTLFSLWNISCSVYDNVCSNH